MQLIRPDIVFILEQIQFEFAGLTPVSPTLPQGLCNLSGKGNLVARQHQFGTADNPLPRASGESKSREAEAGTSYQQSSGIVIGSEPCASESGVTCCEMLAAVAAHAIEHRVAIAKRDCVRTNR